MKNDDSFLEMLREGRAIARECKSIIATFRSDQRAHWESMAGPHISKMLKSREDTESYLGHSDPLLRITSIEVLAHHWEAGHSLANYCQRFAFDDPDDRVREVALITFAFCHFGSKNSNAGRVLAAIVRDEQQTMRRRSAAYQGLYELHHGVVLFWEGNCPSPPTEFPFAEKVDWSLVDLYLQE